MSYCGPPAWSILNYLDENKFFTFITSFTFFTIAIFLYILNSYTVFEKRKIPRAVRPSAPFGNIKDVIFQDSTLFVFLWKYYNKFKRKKCKVGGFYVFFQPGILLVDASFINKICSDETDVDDLFPRRATALCKKIITVINDDVTKDFIKGFVHIEEQLLKNITKNSDTFSEVLNQYLVESTCLVYGIEPSKLLTNLVNTTRNQKYSANFRRFFKLFHPYFSSQASAYKTWKQIIEKSISIKKKTDIKTTNVLNNLMDVLNKAKDTDSKEIFNELFDNFVDNIVHSHSSILWCLYEIAQNSEIQDELLGEIRRYNTENDVLDLNKLEELSFLDALIKETFRKYPPVPTVIKKCKKELVTDLGFNLPKNSLVFLSVYGIQHDPMNYVNPEHFDPDRFFYGKFQKDIFLPFGYGLRTDIGIQFTGVLIKMFLLSVFSKFKIRLEKEYSVEFDSAKLNVHPKDPLVLQFEAL